MATLVPIGSHSYFFDMSPGLLCTFIVKIFISSTIVGSALFILKVGYDIILLRYSPKALLMWDHDEFKRNKLGS